MLATTLMSSTLKFNLPSCGTSLTEASSSASVLSFATKDEVRTCGIFPLSRVSPSFLKLTAKPSSSC